ncbi:MAG TPA: methylmalonyl-CoA mutase family protein [Candidatus Marinimicrobia bacterium]|nr:methylmalonyl-CoA mutase [Candidatus Neomarinimicrobiota bacterium]MDP6276378.1 methylmalonyl-CoA mutase family protein [Candidatus Neomarinimicrobiota bacterium]MDP7329868.1 methylmalonyl-CoA mutase family protein [Candidatus Neomarinimicrobiota bacterium]MDP7436319.1 methylmalonyl-CoA mutase family protein [Candidatus Neomarinimicrobiota bacterium]HBN45649.1 methylmalonyl-CoA mutase [Candidatus Neomarinimicrobiota bacterium]
MTKEQPGKFPFTRGIYPNMYQDRLWTMRQYAGYTTAEESNKRYRYLLDHGVSGLSVAFDLPTQIGYDSNHEMALNEVGKVGVPISTPDDMMQLFKDIPLDTVSTSMTINATAAILLALYIVTAEKQGVKAEQLQGTIQNDILKEYVARGTYIYPPEQSMRIVTDIFDFCSTHIPKWNTISISGYHIREAGSTAAQELAFTLADGIAYVQAAIEKGLDVDTFGKRLSFFFNAHNDFLTEVAKFRAARRMWAHIMKDRFGATNEKAMMCRFHTQTGGSTLTAQQIDNNVVRTTIQAMSAVLGGTQSLHTNSRDEALALPSDEAVKLALRTQQVIAHESGIADHPDPLGGSYAIEQLTDKLEADAKTIIADIDDLGGAVEAIEKGWVQGEIARSAYEYQSKVDSGEQVIVGVNKYASDEEKDTEVLAIDPQAVQKQIKGVADFKSKRNNEHVNNRLAELSAAAKGSENLMPAIITCVKHDCTLGEISDALRAVFGEYHPNL